MEMFDRRKNPGYPILAERSGILISEYVGDAEWNVASKIEYEEAGSKGPDAYGGRKSNDSEMVDVNLDEEIIGGDVGDGETIAKVAAGEREQSPFVDVGPDVNDAGVWAKNEDPVVVDKPAKK